MSDLKYGKDFRDFFLAKEEFFKAEPKKETWLGLGIVLQFALACFGLLTLPIAYLPLWIVVIGITVVITLSNLISIWRRQRAFSSFDRWLKHTGRTYDS